jgi:hypothetical protein
MLKPPEVNAKALDSRLSSRQPALPVILEGWGDSVEDLGLESRLAINEERGITTGRTSRQSSAVTAKGIGSKAYHRLQRRLQTKKSSFDLPRSGFCTNVSYVDSAPLSPLSPLSPLRPELDGTSLHPALTRDGSGDTQRRSSTESEQDALQSICTRLAVALTQHSTNPRPSASTPAGPRSPGIVLSQPSSQQQTRHQSLAVPGGTEPTTLQQVTSYISHSQHEAFERKLLENAAILCEE